MVFAGKHQRRLIGKIPLEKTELADLKGRWIQPAVGHASGDPVCYVHCMRVLIVRLRAIGDVIHALPVACALKDSGLGAFVGWLAEDWASDLIVGHPAIDSLITAPRRGGWSFLEVLRLRRELRALRFDVVVDLQGVRSTVLAALLSGAPRRLAFAGMVGHELRQYISNPDLLHFISRAIAGPLHIELVAARSEQIVNRYLEILVPLGVGAPEVRFGLPEPTEDAQVVAHFLHARGLAEKTYAVINSGGPRFRRWPAERFAAVVNYLGSSRNIPSIVLGGWGDELQAAEVIVTAARRHAIPAPRLSLGQVGALARRSRIFLSGDTGPLHLAAAVGAPCIGLIGHALAERFRPYGSTNILLRGKPVPLDLLRRNGLGEDAMKAIGVDAVCGACDEILARI